MSSKQPYKDSFQVRSPVEFEYLHCLHAAHDGGSVHGGQALLVAEVDVSPATDQTDDHVATFVSAQCHSYC